jgi:hypothetical protein
MAAAKVRWYSKAANKAKSIDEGVAVFVVHVPIVMSVTEFTFVDAKKEATRK